MGATLRGMGGGESILKVSREWLSALVFLLAWLGVAAANWEFMGVNQLFALLFTCFF